MARQRIEDLGIIAEKLDIAIDGIRDLKNLLAACNPTMDQQDIKEAREMLSLIEMIAREAWVVARYGEDE